MNPIQADQIAQLLNSNNELKSAYTADQLLRYAHEYKFLQDEDSSNVIAVVQIKKVQWYQHEIVNLTVSPAHREKDLAKRLLELAENQALTDGARILQATVRENDQMNIDLLKSTSFEQVSTFFNPLSNRNITVWQKVLSPVQ